MDTIGTAAAAVTGARHLRTARNGQDAVATWLGGREYAGTSTESSSNPTAHSVADIEAAGTARIPASLLGSPLAIAVVCDGCSSGASSEVGARLGATLFARALGARLRTGRSPADPSLWAAARADVLRAFTDLLERMPGDRTAAIHDHLLFTIVAAAVTRDAAAVWALGDGAYATGRTTRELGPFADNQPPYLAYDLLGRASDAHLEVVAPSCGSIVIATDGACDLADDRDFLARGGLSQFAQRTFVDHPDALRRHLAVLARGNERIDWDERRVVRTPAVLQDDCAIAVLRWEVMS